MSAVNTTTTPSLSQQFVDKAKKLVKDNMSSTELNAFCSFIDNWIKSGDNTNERIQSVFDGLKSTELIQFANNEHLKKIIQQRTTEFVNKIVANVSLASTLNIPSHFRAYCLDPKISTTDEKKVLNRISETLKEIKVTGAKDIDIKSMKAILYDALSKARASGKVNFMATLTSEITDNAEYLSKDFLNNLANEFTNAGKAIDYQNGLAQYTHAGKIILEEGIQEPKAEMSPEITGKINHFIEKTERLDYKDAQIEFFNLDAEVKAHLVKQLNEAKTIKEARNNGTDLEKWLRTLVDPGNLSSIAATAIIGLIGGSLFGNPMMGLIVTGILNMLGNVNEASPKVERSKPPTNLKDSEAPEKTAV